MECKEREFLPAATLQCVSRVTSPEAERLLWQLVCVDGWVCMHAHMWAGRLEHVSRCCLLRNILTTCLMWTQSLFICTHWVLSYCIIRCVLYCVLYYVYYTVYYTVGIILCVLYCVYYTMCIGFIL